MDDKKRIFITSQLENLIDEFGKYSYASTASAEPQKIDFEQFSKEIEQVLVRLGEAEQIAGIIITGQIPPGMRREKNVASGKVWILINKETWGKMLSLFEKVESSSIVHIAGIPVFEDEDLARRMLFDWRIIPGRFFGGPVVPPGVES